MLQHFVEVHLVHNIVPDRFQKEGERDTVQAAAAAEKAKEEEKAAKQAEKEAKQAQKAGGLPRMAAAAFSGLPNVGKF